MRNQFSGIALPGHRVNLSWPRLPYKYYGIALFCILSIWIVKTQFTVNKNHDAPITQSREHKENDQFIPDAMPGKFDASSIFLQSIPKREPKIPFIEVKTEETTQGETSSEEVSHKSSKALREGKQEMTQTIHRLLKPGQNLTGLLKKYELNHRDIYNIERVLTPYIPPRELQAGHPIDFEVRGSELLSLSFAWEFSKTLRISRAEGTWAIRIVDIPTHTREKYATGVITGSIYQSALKNNLPVDVIKLLINAYSHRVDFQRDIRSGDTYKVLYTEHYLVENPQKRQLERVSYAELVLSGKSFPLIHHRSDSLSGNFYDLDGKLADSFLMKTPINGARLTSYFGGRKHPILGFSRIHKGIDFGAPLNTPVMAAGHGIIEKIGNGGSFGKRIKIKHAKNYHTLYAHLNGFATGLKRGSKVQQGQVIGYLGNTGLSQARHLHYEVHHKGKAIDPLSLKHASSIRLTGSQLAVFNETKKNIIKRIKRYQSQDIDDNPKNRN